MLSKTTLNRWLLGPTTTFRNANRNWLYLGFLLVIVGIVAARTST